MVNSSLFTHRRTLRLGLRTNNYLSGDLAATVFKRAESANLIGFLAFQNGFTLAIGNDRKIAQKDRPPKKHRHQSQSRDIKPPTVKMTAILIVFLVFGTFWKGKHFANWIGAAATTKLCWFMAGIWAFSFSSIWLIFLISQFAGKTPYWPQPWKSVVSIIYGLTCILPLPVI